MPELVESLARRYEVLRPHLSEFQRRLWLGVEAAQLGVERVAVVARATGVAERFIAGMGIGGEYAAINSAWWLTRSSGPWTQPL